MPRVEASQAHQCAVFVKYDVWFGSFSACQCHHWIFQLDNVLCSPERPDSGQKRPSAASFLISLIAKTVLPNNRFTMGVCTLTTAIGAIP
jgi:hypothetical protein